MALKNHMNLQQHKTVIIIGAGMAGLAAAKRLREQGLQPLILEARERIGGRIHTNFSLGTPVSCGAAWIHGHENNPITELAQKAQAKWKIVPRSEFLVYNRVGQLYPEGSLLSFEEKFEVWLQEAKDLAMTAKQDMSLKAALTQVLATKTLSSADEDMVNYKKCFFEGYIGAGYEHISARYWDLEEPWPGENCFLADSYQPLVEYLSKDCRIELNSPVKAIHTNGNGVRVLTDKKSYQADAVIITVPLGVLQHGGIDFQPGLPATKQNAVQRLGMGLLNMAAFKFPRVFWPEDCAAFIMTQLDATSIPIFFNYQRYTSSPVLMGYYGGERGHRIENLSDTELVKQIMNDLRKIFGPDIPEPSQHVRTHWSRDEFSFGSYSYLAIDASAADLDALASPVDGKLFFAGEATHSKHFATTHGAYLSGIRAANEIF